MRRQVEGDLVAPCRAVAESMADDGEGGAGTTCAPGRLGAWCRCGAWRTVHARLAAMSAASTTTFAVHVRLDGWVADGVALARRAEEAGVDSIHVIEGTRDVFVP